MCPRILSAGVIDVRDADAGDVKITALYPDGALRVVLIGLSFDSQKAYSFMGIKI
jgi:hypothetical protein